MPEIKPDDLLSNFFHEAISRVIPGLVVLVLYFHKFVAAALKIAPNSSILCVLSIFIAVWLIGTVIEMFVHLVVIPWAHNFVVIPLAKKRPFFNSQDVVPTDARQLIFYHEYIGEKVMFRGFWMIFAFTVCATPWTAPNIALFTEGKWHCWYGITASALSFIAWYLLKYKSPYLNKDQCENSSCCVI